MKIDKFILGAILVIIGIFVDRILYLFVYLPTIGKTFALHVSTADIFQFYSKPSGWIGLIIIALGVLLILLGRTKKNRDLFKGR